MNKSLVLSSKEELITQYEQLRAEALNPSRACSDRPSGFSIVLHRGIASWIETHLYSELLCIEQNFNEINYEILNKNSINKEATIILTNMVLSRHKLENCYV